MSRIVVIGGGVAGLAAAAALGGDGQEVEVVEARSFPGGRAASYEVPGLSTGRTIDNCQHILLRCCSNLLDFYSRLGASSAIEFHKRFNFIEPGGRLSTIEAGRLPAPFHFSGSFASLRFLDVKDKIAVVRAMQAIRTERASRTGLDRMTMLEWLKEKRQTPKAIARFWQPVLVSAINEDLDRLAASHGFQAFWLGFLSSRTGSQMGVPRVPLGELYAARRWSSMPGVKFRFKTTVTSIRTEAGRVISADASGVPIEADHFISALPPDRLAFLAPELGVHWDQFETSPITGIHLWFDRSVTQLPHAALLDRTIHWFFNKRNGEYLQLVVSASRSLTNLSKREVIDLALRELAEFLPDTRDARLLDAHVVKEMKATFSARPGLDKYRPGPETIYPNLSLAGDWTRTGWPSTMEGAARSGYIAAEHASAHLGRPRRFLLLNIA
jgi:zeta-carotene desaturase